MISIIRYSEDLQKIWNDFIYNSKQKIFMFDRNYMDYHSDRFIDHSLLFYNNDILLGCLPACEIENVLVSHGGLTYGGMVTNNDMKQHYMNEIIDALIHYGREHGLNSVVWKSVPYFYYNQPAEEEKYALFIYGSKLLKVEPSTLLNLEYPIKMKKGRKSQISRAKKSDIVVCRETDIDSFDAFIELENLVLYKHHRTKAVHSSKELKKLRDSFPNNIHLFVARKNNKMIAGCVLYEYDDVIHTQYMAADDDARVLGALDLIIYRIIEEYSGKKKWLDFGISSENNGRYLNHGLIQQKEGFGGRTAVYETWKLKF